MSLEKSPWLKSALSVLEEYKCRDLGIEIYNEGINQTLAEVLNILEQITNRDGDINVFQLKEEIKKIQSQENKQ